MGLVLLTFLVAVVNLGVGYVLTVRLGHGPPSLADAWDALLADPPFFPPPSPERSSPHTAPDPPVARPTDKGLESLAQQLIRPPTVRGAASEEPGPAIEDEPSALPAEDDDGPDGADAPDTPGLANIGEEALQFSVTLAANQAQLAGIDAQLQTVSEAPDAASIAAAVAELKEVCAAHLAEQQAAADVLQATTEPEGDTSILPLDVQQALLERAAQVEITLDHLDQLDAESDPETAAARILEEVANLQAASRKLRDGLDGAFAG